MRPQAQQAAPTQTQPASLSATLHLCIGRVLKSCRTGFAPLWCVFKKNIYTYIFQFSHTHTACMQTRPLAPVYQPAVRGYTYNCVYGAAHLSRNIPPTRTLKKKSHLFSVAICKYSTMNLANRVNHFLSAASSPILRLTSFNLQMFFLSFFFFTLTSTYSLQHSLFFSLYRGGKL